MRIIYCEDCNFGSSSPNFLHTSTASWSTEQGQLGRPSTKESHEALDIFRTGGTGGAYVGGQWAVGQWIVGVMSFQKMYGL